MVSDSKKKKAAAKKASIKQTKIAKDAYTVTNNVDTDTNGMTPTQVGFDLVQRTVPVSSGWCPTTCPAGLTRAVQGCSSLLHAAFWGNAASLPHRMHGRWAPPVVLLVLLCSQSSVLPAFMFFMRCGHSCGNPVDYLQPHSTEHITDRHESTC